MYTLVVICFLTLYYVNVCVWLCVYILTNNYNNFKKLEKNVAAEMS